MLASATVQQHLVLRPELLLVPMLRCPRCGKPHLSAAPRVGDGIYECVRSKHCGQHWWAMVIEEGPVEVQLAWAFEDRELAQLLMGSFCLPAEIDETRYWQIALTGNHAYRFRRAKPGQLFHALGLLKGVI